jgi:hypothetical protein
MIMDEYSVYSKFNLDKHKETFINYLEVVIMEDGTVEYAVPSHQEKLIRIAQDKFNCTRQELFDMCPPEYYFDVVTWLCQQTGCVSVWNNGYIGFPNDKQKQVIQLLIDCELLKTA